MEKRVLMLERLFSALDKESLGDDFKRAVVSKNENAMIRACAGFFRNRPDSVYIREKLAGFKYSAETAKRAVVNDVTVINIPWKFESGINWLFNPTEQKPPVNHEWLWQLGRMSFWLDMACVYRDTGEERYAAAFEEQISSWIVQADKEAALAGNIGKNTWRTIEAGIRLMNSWPAAFEIFRKSSQFSDETLCLMLSSMYEQAVFLRKNHRKRSNWLLMEMAGVYTFASLFPEFKESRQLRIYSAKLFGKAFCKQILPDGMHDELSPDYHLVSLNCADIFLRQAMLNQRMNELPPELPDTVERGYSAMIALMTPGLTAPRTNDGYTLPMTRLLAHSTQNFPDRSDFLWAYSGRQEGSAPAPELPASRFLPRAGFAAMRSSWDADALYACFDAGPLGMGHWHWDKLNINIYKGSQELIYDDGGGQYEKSVFRHYGRSSLDHNIVLVDGKGQMGNRDRRSKRPIDAGWVSNDEFDYICGSYKGFYADLAHEGDDLAMPLSTPATHFREVRFCKPEFFCVVDKLRSRDGKTHDYELRFQLDTLKARRVRKYPGAVMSDYDGEYDILIVPLLTGNVETSILSGRKRPSYAGWFIGRNDLTRHPATTVAMTARTQKNFRFATLLIPVCKNGELPEITAAGKNLFRIRVNGRSFEININALKE